MQSPGPDSDPPLLAAEERNPKWWRRRSTLLQAVILAAGVTVAAQSLSAAPGQDGEVVVDTTILAGGVVSTTPAPEPSIRLTTTTTRTTSTVATTTLARPATTSTSIPPTTTTAPPAAPPGQDPVATSVIDGDTIRVTIGGAAEDLRLIGINSPEGGECYSAEATARLIELVDGRGVVLVGDESDRDQYGRLLRYVYVGDLFVNEVMVREGFAIARRYPPDTAKAEVLEAAQELAEAEGAGLWAPDACGAPAAALLEIATIRYDAEGDDNTNLNDEWVEFENRGSRAVDLTGWTVKDESASHRYPFPTGYDLAAGATVRLHTGCGDDAATDLYWCNQGSAVWNNDGDTVFLLDPSGNVFRSRSYDP
ncbi:MAG TPA: lamin tail domain-containing protein [Acidimicrobiia bacterium]|nr:lamin tail domain-containing protein [Acidimicrobiia bacterium]